MALTRVEGYVQDGGIGMPSYQITTPFWTDPVESEYGQSDVSIGVPVVLGRDGVERILELKLSAKTRKQFENSASIIRGAIEKISN